MKLIVPLLEGFFFRFINSWKYHKAKGGMPPVKENPKSYLQNQTSVPEYAVSIFTVTFP